MISTGQRLLVGEQHKITKERGKNRNEGHIWLQNVEIYAKQRNGGCK